LPDAVQLLLPSLLPSPSYVVDQIHHHHSILARFIALAATPWTPLPFPPSCAMSCLKVRASGQAIAMGTMVTELVLAWPVRSCLPHLPYILVLALP
jgi:hypothetical protein